MHCGALMLTKCIQLTCRKSRTNLKSPPATLLPDSSSASIFKNSTLISSLFRASTFHLITTQRSCGLSLKTKQNKMKDHHQSTPRQKSRSHPLTPSFQFIQLYFKGIKSCSPNPLNFSRANVSLHTTNRLHLLSQQYAPSY